MIQTLIQLDISVLNAIRHLVDPSSPWQKWLVHIFADIQVFAVALFLVAWWLFGTLKKHGARKQEALQIFFVIAFSFVVYMILNQLLPIRPRPETVSAIAPILAHVPDNSFPSGHAIFSAASTLAIFLVLPFFRRLAFISLLLAVPMCVARVMAGVHYPWDILVGWILGTILAALFWTIIRTDRFRRFAIQPIIRLASFIKL